jgi:outer membrane protein TolC
MTPWIVNALTLSIGFMAALGLIRIAPAQAAEIQMQVQAAPAQSAASPTGKLLTIEDAIRIGLENHPRIKSANERVASQQAVLGQQMSAYYPSINLSNQYKTSHTESTSGGEDARVTEAYSSLANLSMTLYNFGKREGNVQAARETLNATKQDSATTNQDIILAVKQAYYVYLAAQALVKVRQETVRSRELLVRQARGFYEVGTRAKIDVARAEANLYTAQADLIAAENGVKIAWVTLRNAMGSPRLPEQPVAEDSPEVEFTMNLAGARNKAFEARTELKSFEAQRRASDQLIATARRGHLPDLIFDASYGRKHDTTDKSDLAPGDPVRNRHINTFPLQPTWSVGLSFNIPIFDGFRTTNRIEETLHNYYNVKAQEEDRRQQIALEVEQSYLRVVEIQERIRATESAARAAKENLDLALGRYQVGVGSIIEVTDAETLYTDAQTTYIRTIYEYKIADAQLARAMGDTRIGVLKPGSIK